MYKYLLVLLDNKSTSFCYYSNNSTSSKKTDLMPYDTLKDIIEYSEKNDIALNFLFGSKKLPDKYNELLETINHAKYIPFGLSKEYEDKVIILESDHENLEAVEYNPDNNIIFRLKKSDLSILNDKINLLIDKGKRINLILLDILSYTQNDMDVYEKELVKISESIITQYKKGNAVELNFLSDRLFLNNMNNCSAGVDHITFAPNGKFYICPGFYYDDENESIGDIKSGINIKNSQLYDLEHAPICSVCDAYHCKRCVWMNKNITLEVNTPSFQQCAISHIEREASRKILERLKSEPAFSAFDNLQLIPKVDYIDPLKVLKLEAKGAKQILEEMNFVNNRTNNGKQNQINKFSMMDFNDMDFESMTTKDLLIEIYKMQRIILRELNIYGGNKNGSN